MCSNCQLLLHVIAGCVLPPALTLFSEPETDGCIGVDKSEPDTFYHIGGSEVSVCVVDMDLSFDVEALVAVLHCRLMTALSTVPNGHDKQRCISAAIDTALSRVIIYRCTCHADVLLALSSTKLRASIGSGGARLVAMFFNALNAYFWPNRFLQNSAVSCTNAPRIFQSRRHYEDFTANKIKLLATELHLVVVATVQELNDRSKAPAGPDSVGNLNLFSECGKLWSDSMVTHKIELHCNSSSSTLHGHLVEVASGTTHEISCSHTQ